MPNLAWNSNEPAFETAGYTVVQSADGSKIEKISKIFTEALLVYLTD